MNTTKQEQFKKLQTELLKNQKLNGNKRRYKIQHFIKDEIETFSFEECDYHGNHIYYFEENDFQEFKERTFMSVLLSVIEQNPKQIKLF